MTSLELVNEIINDMDSLDIDIIEIDRQELMQIKQDLKRYEILKDKFDVYPIEDDECNRYYVMDLNSRDGFFEITEEQYKLLSKVGDNL